MIEKKLILDMRALLTDSMPLKALIQPACFVGAISWLAFVVAIYMVHENGENKGHSRCDTCNEKER